MMSRVNICDICGKRTSGIDHFKIKGLYVKKKYFDWDCAIWRRIDICEDCQSDVMSSVQDLRIKRMKLRKEEV